MQWFPKTVHTDADQRSDRSFLSGAFYGRTTERDRILTVLRAHGVSIPEEV